MTERAQSSFDPTIRPAWADLEGHAGRVVGVDLGDLLDSPGRFEQFSAEGAGLLLDYSRQRIDANVLSSLVELADQCELRSAIRAMWKGDDINVTEGRPALHIALRRDVSSPLLVSGRDIMPDVVAERTRMLDLVAGLQNGAVTGSTGRPVRQLINIGIGGSDLGLVMATEALINERSDRIAVDFVSNIDGQELDRVLERADPEETMIVICSKSFTTQETRLNAESARRWLAGQLGEDAVPAHFVAVSVNREAMDAFGVHPQRRFAIWDWVGGRYSLWSAIGLAIAAATSADTFEKMLAGAAAMDAHFADAPLDENLPVLLGLLGVWNQNFLGASSHVVLPYDRRLHRFPAFLQQLDMESNGKSVTLDSQPVNWQTGAVVWGEPGSNAQHSFFQLLHQGTASFAADFIATARPGGKSGEQHIEALANMLAQAEAFARGRSIETILADDQDASDIAQHRVHAGGKASSIILAPALDPAALGALIALYEHKVYVQSTIWGINAFDQWGVELGKQMAKGMSAALRAPAQAENSPGILRTIRAWR